MACFFLPDHVGNLRAVSTAVIFNFSFGLLLINPRCQVSLEFICFTPQSLPSLLYCHHLKLLQATNVCFGHIQHEMSVDYLQIMSVRQLNVWVLRVRKDALAQQWKILNHPSPVGILGWFVCMCKL